DADGRIGYIKNGVKECEEITTPKWQPFGKVSFPKREVKHVHNLSMKKCSVASGFRKQCSHLAVAIVENNSIKNRIYYIAHSTRKNKGDTKNKDARSVFPDGIPKPITNPHDGDDSKERQKKFTIFPRNFCAPSHAFVFNKKNSEPFENPDFFPQNKICFDVKI